MPRDPEAAVKPVSESSVDRSGSAQVKVLQLMSDAGAHERDLFEEVQ